MKPISKHKSKSYAKTPRQLELERKYRYNRLVSRILKDVRMFESTGLDYERSISLAFMAHEEAIQVALESKNNGNR